MNYSLYLMVWLVFLISGCGVTEKEELPEFEGHFTAEINGEPWSGDTPRADFTFIEEDTLYSVGTSSYDSLLFPYREYIGFSFFVESGRFSYSVLREADKYFRRTGGFYSENDGDAVIARYLPEEAPVNTFTVEFGTDEDGREYAEGTFAMKVVVDPEYDKPNNNQYRQQPDTVLITNGRYRVLLEYNE